MLGKNADFYEEEVDVAVASLTSLIEPLLMVVVGTIVALLVSMSCRSSRSPAPMKDQ